MVGTMALVIILSVFNGLEKMVTGIFGTFDPDVKITAIQGKVFVPDSTTLVLMKAVPGVESVALTLEENALLRYGDRQFIGTLRGVDDHYPQMTGLNKTMWDGEFVLYDQKNNPTAVIGLGVANTLGIRLNFITQLAIYMPNRKGSVTSPETSFSRVFLYPSGIFEIEQEFDSKYLFVPIRLVRDLLDYEKEISAIEVKLTPEADMKRAASDIRKIYGADFLVQDRFEQQELFYKVMKSEKLAIFIILTFILIIASFNIIGSLTMLIIEKEKDIKILRSLGASDQLIRRIFIYEGWMISFIGAFGGLIVGFLVCFVQERFGLIKFSSDSLLIDAYPVVIKLTDFFIVGTTVLLIGYLAAWYPVRYLSKKFSLKRSK